MTAPTKADPNAGTALTPVARVNTALQAEKESLAALLEGTGLSTMAFRQDVLLALAKAPKLQAAAQTEQGTRSLVSAAIDAAQLHLRLGGTLGLCALVPYGNEIKLLVQYQGKIELALRSGLVRSVAMGFARERDEFTFDEGSEPFVKHRKALSGDRGAIIAGYAIATMQDGSKIVRVVDREEAMAARAKSAGYAYARKQNSERPDHAWFSHEGEMWAKTAIHRLAKVLPKLPALARMEAAGRVLVDVDTEDIPADATGETVEAEIVEDAPPAEITRPDGSTVNTTTGEVARPWAMTDALWTTVQGMAAAAGVTGRAFAAVTKALGLPDKGRAYTQADYERLVEHLDTLLEAAGPEEAEA